MKSYSFELVERRSGSGAFTKLVALALIGAGAYAGYKKLKGGTNGSKGGGVKSATLYDTEAHEGEDFTARVINAAKRVTGR